MKRPDESDLGKIVVARAAQGDLVAVGRMDTYSEAPTLALRSADGQRVHWRADLCEVLEIDGAVAERLIAPMLDDEDEPSREILRRELALAGGVGFLRWIRDSAPETWKTWVETYNREKLV